MPDQMTPKEKLSDDERREIVLAALAPDANKTEIAEKYGVSRRWIHYLIDEAMEDPEGKFEEAEKEAAFRREVRDLLAERGQGSADEQQG